MKNKMILLLMVLTLISAGCNQTIKESGKTENEKNETVKELEKVCLFKPRGDGLGCTKGPIINSTTVQFTLVNMETFTISNLEWESKPEACPDSTLKTPKHIQRGASAVFKITKCDLTHRERYDVNFTLEYEDENGQKHSSNAKIGFMEREEGEETAEKKKEKICILKPEGQGLECTTDPYINSTTVQFTVFNMNPFSISNLDWNSNPDSCGSLNTPESLERGESAVLNITNCEFTADEWYNITFRLEYEDPNEQTHSNNAKISATAS